MKITGINGSLPLHMAKAYGISPKPLAPAAQSPTQTLSIARSNTVDSFQPTTSTQPTSAAQQLVAGRVSQAVNFDAAQVMPINRADANNVFQMYTRAADKIEAAVAVQIGKTVDLQA